MGPDVKVLWGRLVAGRRPRWLALPRQVLAAQLRHARRPAVGARRRQRRVEPALGAVLAVLLAVLLVGCDPLFLDIPSDLRTPSVAGVVEEILRLEGARVVYRLRSGQSVEVDYDRATDLLGGAQVGELLLAGTDPDGRQWVAALFSDQVPSRPAGCFRLDSRGRDTGEWIETTVGLRLPKALGFDPGPATGTEFKASLGMFCVNEQGEVMSYGFQ